MYELHEVVDKETGTLLDGFLRLPRSLYTPQDCPQDERTERALLAGTHPLSDLFTFKAYVVCDARDSGRGVVARFALTIYPDDDTLYFGFFESVNDQTVAAYLFDFVQSYAREHGFTRIVGPVNASFWIGYRLKTNAFGRPPQYGEPYNKEYYQALLESNGMNITERYISNQYRRAPFLLPDTMQYRARLHTAQQKRYVIRNSSAQSFNEDMDTVFNLITELYSDFPVYKAISKGAFRRLFSGLRYVVDYHMVKIASYQGEPVGFLIGVPDYSNMLNGPLGAVDKLRLMAKRIRSDNYIFLYIGVRPEHRGLGKAIAQTAIKEVYLRHARTCIALTKEERVNSKYIANMIESTFEYVLMEKAVL
jgi:GNAT superfamily N-acetyltransferase